jgi:hypothetical protein
VQGRPRLITPEAREGVLDFLLENGKLANTDKVQFYLKDEGNRAERKQRSDYD